MWSRDASVWGEGRTSCGGFVGQYLHLLLQLFDTSLSRDGGVMSDVRHVGAAFLAVRPEDGVDSQRCWSRLEDSDGGGHPRPNSSSRRMEREGYKVEGCGYHVSFII